MTTPVRIGCVKYLNTLPLVEGLATLKDAEVVAAVPSSLIGMLRGGKVDVALCSVIDAARHDDVRCLPAGMIGCDGPTMTVRLFSRVPFSRITSVGVDTDSHTSAVLMQVVLNRKWGLRPRIADVDARDTRSVGGRAELDAVLLIGDKVMTDAPDAAAFPHQLDLGEAWKEMTGLPFVYAVWMCRAGDEQCDAVRLADAVLDRQRRHNTTRLDWIVHRRAGERHWPEPAAAEYVGRRLKFDVGEEEREAVAKFIAWARELGLCDGSGVQWAASSPCAC